MDWAVSLFRISYKTLQMNATNGAFIEQAALLSTIPNPSNKISSLTSNQTSRSARTYIAI
jgi:hypothetical protein